MSKPCLRFIALAVAAAASHLHAVTPQAAMDAALVPGADFHAASCPAKISASAIGRHITRATKETDAIPADVFDALSQGLEDGPPQLRFLLATLKSSLEKLGVTADNIEQVTASANTGTISLLSLQSADDITAVLFKAPVDPQVLRQCLGDILGAVNAVAAGLGPKAAEVMRRLTLSGVAHGNAAGAAITFKIHNDDDDPAVSFALLADNRVLVVGFQDAVNAVIDRANAGQKAAPSPKLAKLLDARFGGPLVPPPDACFALAIPKMFRHIGVEALNQTAGSVPPEYQAVADAARGLLGFRVTTAYDGKARAAASVLLNDPGRAAALRDFLHINLLGMAKMGLFHFAGKNTAFAESLAAVADGDTVSILAEITAEDIEFFLEKIKENDFDFD